MRTTVPVAQWYKYTSFGNGLTAVTEQDHGRFYHVEQNRESLLIDSGLGLTRPLIDQLYSDLNITGSPRVINTHLHCDHIGLNHLAASVAVNQADWAQYSRGVVFSLKFYHDTFGSEMEWPEGMEIPDLQARIWRPSEFLETGAIVQHGDWTLECLSLPGHTAGHNIYFDRCKKIIFLGDFVYDGALYLHMHDSDFSAYLDSLDQLIALIEDIGHKDLLLLSSHNSLPLNVDYVYEVREFLKKMVAGKIQPEDVTPPSEGFDAARCFQDSRVRVFVRERDSHF